MSENQKTVIGTRIITVTDETREEKLGTIGGKRVVSARLYYPALYGGEPEVTLARTMGKMYQGAKPLDEDKYPLIVYNPGYGSMREANNRLCCELAKNGYFVAAVGHAYESASLELADGSYIDLDPSIRKKQITPRIRGTVAALKMKGVKGGPEKMYEAFDSFQRKYCSFLNERLPEWACDVRCIVSMLKKEYADSILFEKGIGMTGHSFGGNLSYYMCMKDEEYVCGVNMDGAIFGDYHGQRMKRPFLQICNRGNVPVVSKALLHTDAPIAYEVFDDTAHMGFTDLSFFYKSRWMMGKMDPEERSQRLLLLHLRFFDQYLRRNPTP